MDNENSHNILLRTEINPHNLQANISPKNSVAQPDNAKVYGDRPEAAHSEKSLKSASGIFKLLAYPVFLVLLWLRGFVRLVLTPVSSASTFAFVVIGLWWWLSAEGQGHPVLPKATLALGITSFISISIMWVYDSLLIWLSPEPIFFIE